MTSRAEYRLVLRQDNADLRLTQKAYDIGLASEERYERFLRAKRQMEEELLRLKRTSPPLSDVNDFLNSLGMPPLENRISTAELLKRPGLSYALLASIDPDRPRLPAHVTDKVEVEIKYAGYIEKQRIQIEEFKRLESMPIPEDTDFLSMDGLRIEARQKLDRIRPLSVGQAARISGVSPADIDVLTLQLHRKNMQRAEIESPQEQA